MTRPLRKPTPRQFEVVEFVRAYCSEYGASPSVRGIARHFGVNHGTMQRTVRRAIRNGLFMMTARVVRVRGGLIPVRRKGKPVVKHDGVALGRRGRKVRKGRN